MIFIRNFSKNFNLDRFFYVFNRTWYSTVESGTDCLIIYQISGIRNKPFISQKLFALDIVYQTHSDFI